MVSQFAGPTVALFIHLVTTNNAVRPSSLPNLKRICLLSKVIRGSQNFEIGSCDPGHAHLCRFMVYAGGYVRPPSLYQISSGLLNSFNRGGPEIGKLGHVTPATPKLGVVLWSLQREALSSVCAKSEADRDSSFRSKGIRGIPRFGNWVTWPRPRQFMGRFIFRMQGPSSISVLNLKRIAQFLQKLLRGPEIRKLGHVTPATPT